MRIRLSTPLKLISIISARAVCVCTLLAPTLSVLAESIPATPDSVAPERITVIGTRSEQLSTLTPTMINIITASDIRQSAATTLVQVLSAQPGLQISDNIGNGGRVASLSMRGFGETGGNNILVLVNGRKLNNPSLAGPDLSGINLADIERIEILQGSAGSLYGDQATAGVINIITVKAAEALQATLEAGRGSDDLESYRATAAQSFPSGVSYRLSGEKKLADNYRDNNEQNSYNLSALVDYSSDAFAVYIDASRVRDDLRLPGSLDRTNEAQNRRQSLTPTHFSNQDNDVLRIGGHVDMTPQWQFLGDYSQRSDAGAGSFFSTPFTTSVDMQSITPRITGSVATANGDMLIVAGVDKEITDYKADYGFSLTDITQKLQDIYTQVTAPLSSQLSVTAGGRSAYFDYTNHQNEYTQSDSLQVYQLGSNYVFSNTLRLFARFDQGFRWPNADENGFISPVIEALQPQHSNSLEMGFDCGDPSLKWSVMVYQLKVKDELIYDPTGDGPFGPGTGANINLDESVRRGFVITNHWQRSENISVNTSYSVIDAKFSSGNFNGNDVPLVATQLFKSSLTIQFTPQWSLVLESNFTGKRFRAGDVANSAGQTGGYTVFNAGLRWEQNSVYVSARLNNFTGKQYSGYSGGAGAFAYDYPAAEASYQFVAGYRF